MNAIGLRGIQRTYRGAAEPVQAVRGIDLDVDEGEFVAITGPSGSGKSTLLGILGLLERADGGDFRLCGENVQQMNERARALARGRLIGFVFQGYNLLKRLSAVENVALPMLYAGASRRASLVAARNMLERFELGHVAARTPERLSGGQQQRVAIARALVNEPRIILADEPTGNLDSQSANAVLALLELVSRQSTATVLLVTHDLAIANRASRRVVLTDGRIVEDSRASATPSRAVPD